MHGSLQPYTAVHKAIGSSVASFKLCRNEAKLGIDNIHIASYTGNTASCQIATTPKPFIIIVYSFPLQYLNTVPNKVLSFFMLFRVGLSMVGSLQKVGVEYMVQQSLHLVRHQVTPTWLNNKHKTRGQLQSAHRNEQTRFHFTLYHIRIHK